MPTVPTQPVQSTQPTQPVGPGQPGSTPPGPFGQQGPSGGPSGGGWGGAGASDPGPAGGRQGGSPTAQVQSQVQNIAGDGGSFFRALFDFSFTHFVTPMLVRFVYLLATLALGAAWLVWLIAAFVQNVGLGLVVLVLGPIVLVIYLALIRMTLEFYISVVRMSEDIHKRLPQA
ncbi:DUF4282 domain-containing protein [Terracoccus luteus]|uniref:DUF4282 domain-containing protein n=1 Tax=Terracoccus luteus TaxID=53356 RepID=A0A839PRV1_9MICO|nr:DUF4282 domain-containing protein [Terracoccus luteus]MBB2986910.1 hypothetical protein [Terracoccus luteus]MCP2172561.1 hypothetical protein [Terracoccus luteus]